MDSIKHFTIGAHQVPFTIERSNVRTITAFVGELLGVHIVLRVADSAHNTIFYDITLTRGENSITFRSVNELLLSSTVSFNLADLNRLSPVDAFNAGLLDRLELLTRLLYLKHTEHVRKGELNELY